MDELKINGIYMHYKNKKYRALGLAVHSETLEEMVVYEALYPNKLGQLWVRPRKIFFEHVDVENYKGPRFRLLENI